MIQGPTLWAIRTIALLGCLLFGLVFGLTYLAPERIETMAKAFVVDRVKDEVAGLRESTQGQLLRKAYQVLEKRYEEELAKAETALAEDFPERMATLIGELCQFDCAAKSRLATALRQGLEDQAAALKLAIAQFRRLAQNRYSAILAALITEIRIFTGCNLAIFISLLLASFLAGPRFRFLVLPSLLLLVSTLLAVYFYLFEQNWFYTILFERYLGYGYLGYVGFLFLWLCDIVYLQARVTRAVIDGLASLLSKCGFPA